MWSWLQSSLNFYHSGLRNVGTHGYQATWYHIAENRSLQQSESPISGFFVKLLILTLNQEKSYNIEIIDLGSFKLNINERKR